MNDLVLGIGLVIVILGTILYTDGSTDNKWKVERFVDTGDYTQDYTRQIEEWATMEETLIKLPIEALAKKNNILIPWKEGVDKSSITSRRAGLPDVDKYVSLLTDIDKGLNDQFRAQDEIFERTPDMDNAIRQKQADIITTIQKQSSATTLPSLSILKDRGNKIVAEATRLAGLMVVLDEKRLILASNREAPTTPEKIVEYELEKFAKPFWPTLEFAVKRIAKVLSIGPDGKQTLTDAAALDQALAEMAKNTQVNDLSDFYKMMANTNGSPKLAVSLLKDFFEDPLAYINIMQYLVTRFKEMSAMLSGSGPAIAGFENMTAQPGMSGSNAAKQSPALLTESKCVPCAIEPEIKDMTALRRRYTILRDSYKKFKELLAQTKKMQEDTVTLEKKAISGELADDMIKSGKFKVE